MPVWETFYENQILNVSSNPSFLTVTCQAPEMQEACEN